MNIKNLDEQKRNFVIIHNFFIKVSSVVVFDINTLANITLMGKIPRKYRKSKKLTKFTLNYSETCLNRYSFGPKKNIGLDRLSD